jgi:hypothetical protein
MTSPTPRPDRRPRLLAFGATLVALAALGGVLAAAPAASGDRDARVDRARLAANRRAATKLDRSIQDAPVATRGRCTDPAEVAGVGLACRDADGLLVIPTDSGEVLMSHGPDLVDATPGHADADGGFGTTDSITCSAPSSSRHVVLAYLLPSDHAVAGAPGVHGDRSAEVIPQLRQAFLDAATTVDRRAGELVPGARRRMRVACGADGLPIVERIVLPRTASVYRDSADGGFVGIESDLSDLDVLPDYDDFSKRHVPAVRRVLAYYDADYDTGVAGQGVMFRRSAMLAQGAAPNDPLISKTVRNINNNPPNATFAVQYGTSYGGVPDPPLYTSLLHELAHTMGAVQDEPATSSDAGHCLDGLDLMCYDDGGPGGTYSAAPCADPTPATVDAADEQFDCNGDTYFHPAPTAPNPLADPLTWHLGLVANEVLSDQGTPTPPPAVTGLVLGGRGTQVVLRWAKVVGARGYDVAFRPAGGTWRSIAVPLTAKPPVATPPLRARTDYEFVVTARDARSNVGGAATAARRTGVDTTLPKPPSRPIPTTATRTSLQLRFGSGTDNERVTRYLVERRVGRRWVSLSAFPAPATDAASVTSPRITRLRPGTAYVLRVRAIDARGNRSAPSAVSTGFTRR